MYEELVNEIIEGRRLGKEDDLTFLIDGDLESLCQGADKIRKELCGNQVDLCTIINGRAGRLILFKECLKNDIIPFVVNDSRKAEYYHVLNTAQTKQDYSLLERFFREEQTEYRQQVEGFLPPVKE